LRAWALASIVVLACLGCDTHPAVTYGDRLAAQRAGAIGPDRIPEWIPKSARDLRELRDRETKRSMMLAFGFDRLDRMSVPGSCSHATGVPPAPFAVSWWPSELRSASGVTDRYAFYACESGRAFLAIRVGRGEAYYWRP